MKKNICRVGAVSVIILTFIISIAAAAVNVSAAEKSWQESYLEVIDNSKDDSSAYMLSYIDDNDIPELYMWDNTTQLYSLYTYHDGNSVLCDNWSNRESMWLYDNKNGCFWFTRKSNALCTYMILQKLENGSYTELYSFCIDRRSTPDEKYLINDTEVGKDEYERKMAELETDYPLSNDFQVNGNGKISQTYDEIRQYLMSLTENEDTQETENTNETETAASAEKAASATTAAGGSQRVPSPKTGDTEPVFCESAVIGFIMAGTIMLLRKKYKCNEK